MKQTNKECQYPFLCKKLIFMRERLETEGRYLVFWQNSIHHPIFVPLSVSETQIDRDKGLQETSFPRPLIELEQNTASKFSESGKQPCPGLTLEQRRPTKCRRFEWTVIFGGGTLASMPDFYVSSNLSHTSGPSETNTCYYKLLPVCEKLLAEKMSSQRINN